MWDARTLANGTVFTLTTDLGVIDLMTEVTGIGAYADVRMASTEAQAFGRMVRVLDLPSLIRAKRAAGRPKDLLILPELEGILEASEDKESS